MKRTLLAALLVCLVRPLAAEDASSPVVVRESLEPADGAVVGQHVALRVDVLFRGAMVHPPRVSVPDVAAIQVMQFQTQATNLDETIDGNNYVGQRFEFALYARRGGSFEIGPASVTLLDRQGEVIGSAAGQAVLLNVVVPQGVDASGPVVATRRLVLNEQWAPVPTTTFKTGDAIVRTITRTAEDVPGLALRDLDFPAPKGVRAYADPPEIDDRENRGVITGRRVDRVTYVFEQGGGVTLPAATQPWWDLGAKALRSATATGATVNVAATPQAPTATTFRTWAWLAAAMLSLSAGTALACWHVMQRQQTDITQAERKAFAGVRRACSGTDAAAIYHAFARWRGLLDPVKTVEATHAAARLDAVMFANGAPMWTPTDSQKFIAALANLRRSHPIAARLVQLPPLNPGGGIEPSDASSRAI
jgi:hypothetical protein